jgi:putative transcriptional regulator
MPRPSRRPAALDGTQNSSLVVLVRLDEVLAARGRTLTWLSETVGITPANLSILKTGKARAVRFSTLALLCEALECTPGDLLAVEPRR